MRTPSASAASAAFAAFVAFVACAGASGTASAGDMDPTPERFVTQPPGLPSGQTCQSIAANPEIAIAAGKTPNDFLCRPDNSAFRNYVSEMGFAIAPTAFHPARTTGFGGFALSLDASFTHVNADGKSASGALYWHEGTKGANDPNTGSAPTTNATPDSIVAIYGLTARKGLPFGFELGGSFGFVGNTDLWVFGGDLRWSILEGFRKGSLGYVPDLSVGGGARTLTGTNKFSLTTVGIDVQASKPFAISGQAQLTPWIGFQRLLIFGDSSIIDTTPNVDPIAACGETGVNASTGQPTCAHKLSNGAPNDSDFNNNVTFDPVRIQRNRAMVGLQYRYDILLLASQFAFDLTDPSGENNDVTTTRQWTLSFAAGVQF